MEPRLLMSFSLILRPEAWGQGHR